LLTAISKAVGILAARKKSIRRNIPTKDPYLKKRILVSCYRFKVKDGSLVFSVSKYKRHSIRLTKYVLSTIEGHEVRSFTLTPTSLTLSFKKNTTLYVPKSLFGIDRNASNVVYGNSTRIIQFDLKKIEDITSTTRKIVKSFRRNDVRIRTKLSSKYGKRRSRRSKQILHHVSKIIVENLKQSQGVVVFENIEGLRNLYKKGNNQSRNFRARMNSVPWYEIKRLIEYKAGWEGVPVLQLTKGETRGTSKFCPICGERLQEGSYSRIHRRELWCEKCRRCLDRDVVAVMNISYKGWLRFDHSEGEAGEAMVQEPKSKGDVVILKVDASKLSTCPAGTLLHLTTNRQNPGQRIFCK